MGSEVAAVARCARCGSEIAQAMLACPSCGKLVHTGELERLSSEAERLGAEGNIEGALAAWRAALELLPPTTRQYAQVWERVRALEPQVTSAAPKSKAASSPWGMVVALGALLVGGLSKAGTLFSMLAMVGVYWVSFGWKFALGVVASLYVHEMGHVALLRRYRIPATAPMFVPGLGAFVRLKQYPASPRADAHVGLAGPIFGLGAALVAKGLSLALGSPIWGAIAEVGALINLFNLLPIGSLDGGRGVRSLTAVQRLSLAIVCGMAWMVSRHWLPAVIGVLVLMHALAPAAPKEPDHAGFARFAVLIAALTALSIKAT